MKQLETRSFTAGAMGEQCPGESPGAVSQPLVGCHLDGCGLDEAVVYQNLYSWSFQKH